MRDPIVIYGHHEGVGRCRVVIVDGDQTKLEVPYFDSLKCEAWKIYDDGGAYVKQRAIDALVLEGFTALVDNAVQVTTQYGPLHKVIALPIPEGLDLEAADPPRDPDEVVF